MMSTETIKPSEKKEYGWNTSILPVHEIPKRTISKKKKKGKKESEGSWRLPLSWGANNQFRIMKPPILFINLFKELQMFNERKRKNMDETHQSCLFTKYQKGQLVKKRKKEKKNQRAHDDCLFHEVPTTNSELWNHQFCSSIYSRSCKCSMRESIKKICSALPKIKHNQTKRNGYFRYRNWMLAYREQDNCHETDERPNSFS